jgi:large subunit ribosomal protein L10
MQGGEGYMITRETKAKEIQAISDRFSRAKAAFLVDFKGLNVENVTQFRKALTSVNSDFRVIKNTLALRALKDHPEFEGAIKDSLTGNNGVVFAYEDPSASAKTIAAFLKENEAMVLKKGAMDGKALDEAMVKYLATLPGKQELRAKLLGTLQGPMATMLGLMNNVPGTFVRLLSAYKDQKEKAS